MSLSLAQSATAVATTCPASFVGIGGTPPYVYSVLPNGAGGTINSRSGRYTSPAVASSDPKFASDTIQVVDSTSATATTKILVGTPLILFCDIIQNQLGLANGRVYVWDQKIFQPTDSGLYIAISVPRCKPFGNVNETISSSGGMTQIQSVNMLAVLDIDIISRGPEARDRKEEVILALKSQYAEQQQEAGSFSIGTISTAFLNLSLVDGAAIPYRYRISVQMQYVFVKSQSAQYFSNFSNVSLVTEA